MKDVASVIFVFVSVNLKSALRSLLIPADSCHAMVSEQRATQPHLSTTQSSPRQLDFLLIRMLALILLKVHSKYSSFMPDCQVPPTPICPQLRDIYLFSCFCRCKQMKCFFKTAHRKIGPREESFQREIEKYLP